MITSGYATGPFEWIKDALHGLKNQDASLMRAWVKKSEALFGELEVRKDCNERQTRQ